MIQQLTVWPERQSEWLASNFSLQYHPWIKRQGLENKGNDHQLKKLLIIELILLVSTSGTVQRTVLGIWILILECRGLNKRMYLGLSKTSQTLFYFMLEKRWNDSAIR